MVLLSFFFVKVFDSDKDCREAVLQINYVSFFVEEAYFPNKHSLYSLHFVVYFLVQMTRKYTTKCKGEFLCLCDQAVLLLF